MANVYQEPFRAFRFLVELEGGRTAVAAFSQFSGVKMEIQSIKARSGDDPRGVQSGVGTFTEFSPVTLTKGVVGDEEFLDWLFSAAAGPDAGPAPVTARTINIVALDYRGTGASHGC